MRTMVLMMVFSMFSLLLALMNGCAVDGGPGLILDRAWWRDPGVLRVALWTARDGTFELEEERGERRPGLAECLDDRCLVTFDGATEPRYLWHLVAGEERGAPLLECGEDPFGLCPFGYTCVDRACAPLCSATHPSGACVADGAVCDDGWCSIPES